MLQVAFGQSKYYSDNLVENITRGIRQKVRRGEWLVRAPFGYVNNPKTRNIEPHPTKSRIVVKAFEEYAKGTHTLGTIADFLADHLRIETRHRTPPAKASVARMLSNRVYLGFTFHKGEYYDGSFAPIISPTLFEAVQKMLAKKSRPRVQKVPNHFPFAQFARCGECGSMITAQYATNRFGTKYTYYRCTKKKGVCRQPYLSSSALISQAKICFNQCRFLFQKLRTWKNKLTCGRRSQFPKEEVLPKTLKPNFPKRRRSWTNLFPFILTAILNAKYIYSEKTFSFVRKQSLRRVLRILGNREKIGSNPCGVSFCL